jgi:hypothetical protein
MFDQECTSHLQYHKLGAGSNRCRPCLADAADAECLADADARAGFSTFSLAVSDDVVLPDAVNFFSTTFEATGLISTFFD